MYAYYISSVGNLNGKMILHVGEGRLWSTIEPGTTPVYVSPFVDFHAINGQMFLGNKVATLVECKEEGMVNRSGVLILAHNYWDARKMLSHE